MLSKVRHYVNKKAIRSLYFSLFSSHINYCCQVWGQNENYQLNRIHSLQRSALRIINFRPFRSDVSDLFYSLNIPSFSNIIRVSNLTFVFDSLTQYLPVSISNFFDLSCNVHSHFTRNTENAKLAVPAFKSKKYGKYSIKYQCVIEWNKSLININNAFLFKYSNSHFNSFLDLKRQAFIRLIRKIIYAQ